MYRFSILHGFTISVLVLVLPIFPQLLLRNEKILSKSLLSIEWTQHVNSRWQQRSYFTSFSSNWDIICFQIDIIIRFNCYKQSDHILLNQEREFSADAVWPLQIQIRFTMACCWMNIYLKLKPGTWLFGTSWWKVIQAFWLYRIAQVSWFLLARGAKVVNLQTAKVETQIGTYFTSSTKYTPSDSQPISNHCESLQKIQERSASWFA